MTELEATTDFFEETGFHWLDHGQKLTVSLEDLGFVLSIATGEWVFSNGMGTSIPWTFKGPEVSEIWPRLVQGLL